MADKKISELTEDTSPESTDMLELLVDPAGTPDNKSAQLATILGASAGAGVNLVKNSPGQIVVDGAEPQW